MGKSMLPKNILKNYEVFEWKNATAILKYDYPAEYDDLIDVLDHFSLPKSDIIAPGGRKSPIAKNINGSFYSKGWLETKFELEIEITETGNPHNGQEKAVNHYKYSVPTHQIDYYKNSIAVETEWNNKDPFYDRDLNNFRLLHEFEIISVGVFITRATDLQILFNQLGKGSSYGSSTTHMDKLVPRIQADGSGSCPVLAFAITDKLYDPNQ